MVYNVIPCLSLIKKFGCLVFATTSDVQRTKLNSRTRKCVFPIYMDLSSNNALVKSKLELAFLAQQFSF